ncbi:MAG: hypothetical protein Q4D97_02225 [Eubacteriales bacterium]|nr:hypothetical protein [Eubacteriales bacterium]
MLEPKFVPFITDKSAKTPHGVEYSILLESTPEELKEEYRKLIESQDEQAAKGKPISIF